MITLKNLHKSYEVGQNKLHVLNGIDLTIEKGELVSIMGSSGSGKSTLLNIIGLLDTYDEGELFLDDDLIRNYSLSKMRDLNEKRAARLRN
ncbi:MAG: macrolide ABC transporter ATP-binding protein, partial [Bacteroidetes bacterium]